MLLHQSRVCRTQLFARDLPISLCSLGSLTGLGKVQIDGEEPETYQGSKGGGGDLHNLP